MARRRGRRLLSDQVPDTFKQEIAADLGLTPEIQRRGWGDMATRDLGRIGGPIGGSMVRVMIRQAEEAMARDPNAVRDIMRGPAYGSGGRGPAAPGWDRPRTQRS